MPECLRTKSGVARLVSAVSHAVVSLADAGVWLGVGSWDTGSSEVSLGLAHGWSSKKQSSATYIIIIN